MTNPTELPNVIELASQLVRLPSVNPMGRGLPPDVVGEGRVTDWLEQHFGRLKVPAHRYKVRQDATDQGVVVRENILARFDGTPTVQEGGSLIMLEAHQDTVPIDGMTIEPFNATISDGRLHGRGSCDIKGGMATILAAAESIHQSRQPKPTIVVACTVNEEFGFCGAKHLAALLDHGGDHIIPRVPDAIIVTEPTELHVVTCHKGMVRWVCETTGIAAHSSAPDAGENAIYRMAPVLAAIDELGTQLSQRDGDAMMGTPTLSVGTIAGGISVNTVPDSCKIEIDRRLLPNEDQHEAREEIIDATKPKQQRHIHHHDPFITSPGLSADNNESLAHRLVEVASCHEPDRQVTGVPYGTDAAFLAQCGAPTIVFGPGSIEQAHTKDEWVEIRQLETAVDILIDFIRSYDRD